MFIDTLFPWSHVRRRLILIAFLILPGVLLAQSKSVKNNTASAYQWKLDATQNGVKFYHVLADCNGAKVVLLKFENTNAYAVAVSWKEKFTTQVETKANGSRGVRELNLPAGGTIVPSGCADNSHRDAVITSMDVQPHYVAEIRDYEFSDINVRKTN